MFGLPPSTELNKMLPKTQIFEVTDISNKEKRIIDDNISTLYFTNCISNKTLPQINSGDDVQTIWFIIINLKKVDNIENTITILFKSIPQKIILILHFDNKYKLACFYEKLFISDYIDDSYSIKLEGLSLDKIYENLIAEIGSIAIKDDYTLKQQIEENDKIDLLNKEIKILENKCKNEKQFNKKVEINKKINELKIELSRYQV